MSSKRRVIVRYSDTFNLQVFEKIGSGWFTPFQAHEFHKIGGAGAVNTWIVQYRDELLSKIKKVKMKDEKIG